MLRTNMSNLKLLGLLILIIAIPVTLYLVRHPQIFKGRALEESTIQFFRITDTTAVTPITSTPDQNVKLKLTYSSQTVTSTPTPTPTPAGAAQSSTDQCSSATLRDGQTIAGDTQVVFTAVKSSPASYLSLQVVNSRLGSFQVVSTESNILFANISSASLFQNGQATIECRIQTDPIGGTIISSNQVRVNVAN